MTAQLDFNGRVAVVTGAGRGIGRETALALARRGARVLVNDYGGTGTTMTAGTIEIAEQVVDEIRSDGGTAIADGSSVGSRASAEQIIDHANRDLGRVDILVNNAGGAVNAPLDEHTDEQIDRLIETLLFGPYALIRQAWPIMREQRFGRIVNVLSGALLGLGTQTPYSTAKAGLIGLTNSAAFEGASLGIAVNGVWPNANTRLITARPNSPFYAAMQHLKPQLVAEAIVYLCAAECQLSGEMFSVGGGRVARVGIVDGTRPEEPLSTEQFRPGRTETCLANI
jgi:NAD(P)-dependent dehydrogenase (short-subunit alcohol dehydrogenase family)